MVNQSFGVCYSNVLRSRYDLAGPAMPELGRGLVQATVLRLHQGGIQLFDAGTTAGYFQDLYGFRRTTRSEFVRLWRKHRRDTTSAAAENTVWARPCTGMHALLGEGSQTAARATESCHAPARTTRTSAKRPRTVDVSKQEGRKLPSAVVLTGTFEESAETEAAIRSALASCGVVVRCIVKAGTAIVQLSTPAEAEAAVKLSGSIALGAQKSDGTSLVQICFHLQRKRAKAKRGDQRAPV